MPPDALAPKVASASAGMVLVSSDWVVIAACGSISVQGIISVLLNIFFVNSCRIPVSNDYRKVSNIRRTKFQNLNTSRLIL